MNANHKEAMNALFQLYARSAELDAEALVAWMERIQWRFQLTADELAALHETVMLLGDWADRKVREVTRIRRAAPPL